MPLTQQAIYPRDAYATTPSAKWFYLGAQASGDIENKVSGKAVAAKNVSFTDPTCWATAGYATVGGGASNYCTIDPSTTDLDSLAGGCLIVAIRMKKVAAAFPAVENYVFASYKPGSQYGGIVIASKTDGGCRLYVNSTDNTTASLTTAANVITNGTTANEHTYVFMVPGDGGNGYIGIDGLEVVSSSMAALAGKTMAGGWGGRLGISLAGVAIDAHQVASFQVYCPRVSLTTINRQAVYDWVQKNPHLRIPEWMWGL